jgi:hypothetical protein
MKYYSHNEYKLNGTMPSIRKTLYCTQKAKKYPLKKNVKSMLPTKK